MSTLEAATVGLRSEVGLLFLVLTDLERMCIRDGFSVFDNFNILLLSEEGAKWSGTSDNHKLKTEKSSQMQMYLVSIRSYAFSGSKTVLI